VSGDAVFALVEFNLALSPEGLPRSASRSACLDRAGSPHAKRLHRVPQRQIKAEGVKEPLVSDLGSSQDGDRHFPTQVQAAQPSHRCISRLPPAELTERHCRKAGDTEKRPISTEIH
jgi:hypothetical protein